MGTYGQDFYQGMPAVARNHFGKGCVYYIGTHLEEQGLGAVLDQASADAGVEAVVSGGEGLEIVRRTDGVRSVWFIMNFGEEERPVPACFRQQKDLLSGQVLTENTRLKKYDVVIIG